MTTKGEKPKATTDHETIREWAEERDGHPSRVKTGTRAGDGLLRIDFGEPEESLETITWEQFFEIFDKNDLAFLYQEEKDGELSRFFKFVRRGSEEE